jgi:hypothetical protein
MKGKLMADRRKFLKGSMAGVAGLVIGSSSNMAFGADAGLEQVPAATAQQASVTNDVDVLVVGGGTAGTIAAIQAARAGATTLIVERNSKLGGTTTVGGVSFPGLFDAWGNQIIAGIGWELVRDSVILDGGSFPDFSVIPSSHPTNQVQVNQFLYAIMAEEKCEQAGVEIAFYEFPQAITATAGGWQVDCVGFGTQRTVNCKQIIDCTGGAEVVGMLGLPRLREAETQPGAIKFKTGGANSPGRAQLSQIYVCPADSSNSRTVTTANLAGRQSLLARVRNNPSQRLMHMQAETSFRESYRIDGETIITEADYRAGKYYSDALCNAFYPVDLHFGCGTVHPSPLNTGAVPTVPLSALVPKLSSNIIVAGRCVSSDRMANSGLRVQASCMAMGQAAGAAAALAADRSTTPLALPIADIRTLLAAHDAIIPVDPNPSANMEDLYAMGGAWLVTGGLKKPVAKSEE